MTPRTRRALLALLAGATTPLAGCQTSPGGSSPTRPTASPTDTPRDEPPTSPTAAEPSPAAVTDTASPGRTLVLTRQSPSPGTAATVYPERLRSLLREAATTDGPLRVRAATPVYAPEPVLPGLREVHLESEEGAVDGRYAVRAEGGPYYEWRVGATLVEEAPEGADATPVRNLPLDRRALVERALEPGGTLVSPESEQGSWVRHEFLGGYFSDDGATYRGRKLQQTDAAFFSREVWYVISLSPVPESGTTTGSLASQTPTATPDPPVTLRLRTVPNAVRQVVDGTVGTYHRDRVTADLADADVDTDVVARFAREVEGLLFHAAAYVVEVVEDGHP